jgi:acetyl-CoA acetyltransferase
MSFVKIETPRPGIALVTLDRPERMNAMAFDVMVPLREALEQLSFDNTVRVVVLTGAGEGFCSGADLVDPGYLPIFDGLTVPGKYALIAQRWMHRHGGSAEDLAAVAVAARAHAARQATAPKRDPLSIEAVLASPMIASPLRVLDCCPVTDWGGAMILTTLERARDLRKTPVRLLGGGACACRFRY